MLSMLRTFLYLDAMSLQSSSGQTTHLMMDGHDTTFVKFKVMVKKQSQSELSPLSPRLVFMVSEHGESTYVTGMKLDQDHGQTTASLRRICTEFIAACTV